MERVKCSMINGQVACNRRALIKPTHTKDWSLVLFPRIFPMSCPQFSARTLEPARLHGRAHVQLVPNLRAPWTTRHGNLALEDSVETHRSPMKGLVPCGLCLPSGKFYQGPAQQPGACPKGCQSVWHWMTTGENVKTGTQPFVLTIPNQPAT